MVTRQNVLTSPEVTTVTLRDAVAVHRLLKRALAAAAEPNNGRAVPTVDQLPAEGGTWLSPAVATRTDRPSRPSGGSRTRRDGVDLDANVRRFAEAYNEAMNARGQLKVKRHACRAAGITEGSYGRYLREARQRGYIKSEEN